MKLTVKDAMKLNKFSNLKLVAGSEGLNRELVKVGILDYEYVKDTKSNFIQGEFVMTSFLYAKDDEDLLLSAVKTLYNDGVSGIAVKDVFFDRLPESIIRFANIKSLPIFMFNNPIYFEELIVEVSNRLKAYFDYGYYERKVNSLMEDNISNLVQKKLALDINNRFNDNLFTLFIKNKIRKEEHKTINLLEFLKSNRIFDLYSIALMYNNGILIITTGINEFQDNVNTNFNNLSDRINLDLSDYYIGISNYHDNLHELGDSIKESMDSSNICQTLDKDVCFYNEIGTYKIILPFINEYSVVNFSENIINPIIEYDKESNSNLLDTALAFIASKGNIKKTAEILFQHNNTIRYRLNKIKSILNLSESEYEFYEHLSYAVKVFKIKSITKN
jgi:hypothetical protein